MQTLDWTTVSNAINGRSNSLDRLNARSIRSESGLVRLLRDLRAYRNGS